MLVSKTEQPQRYSTSCGVRARGDRILFPARTDAAPIYIYLGIRRSILLYIPKEKQLYGRDEGPKLAQS